jgi:chromosome segregation ATPase
MDNSIVLPNVTMLLGGASVQSLLDQLMPEVQRTIDRLCVTVANLRVDIEVLQNRLQDCETFNRNIHADFELMESGIDDDHKRIIAAEASIGKLNKATDYAESSISDLVSDMEDLTGRVDTIESDAQDIETRLDESDSALGELNTDSIADDIRADVETHLDGIRNDIKNLFVTMKHHDTALEHVMVFQDRIKEAALA